MSYSNNVIIENIKTKKRFYNKPIGNYCDFCGLHIRRKNQKHKKDSIHRSSILLLCQKCTLLFSHTAKLNWKAIKEE